MEKKQEFETFVQAYVWMYENFENADSLRSALLGDSAQMAEFYDIAADGCCGKFEEEVIIGGQPAIIGCNYGH